MITPTVERAAISALYWARPAQRDADAIRGCCSHLSKEERREVVSLLDLRIFDPLSDDELRAAMATLAAKSRAGEHKIADTERKIAPTAVLAPPAVTTDTGTFTGYLAAFGVDHGGDTIGRDAMTATVAEFNAGRIAWHLTDAHSEKASDVVATVTAAAVDRRGLRIDAAWMPTPRAQELRTMVRAGAKLGLSIDYFPVAARPDGAGGRFLDRITVVGGAVTPKPANAAAVITEGKGLPWPVDADLDAQQERLESWAETAAGRVARDTLAGMMENPGASMHALALLERGQLDAAQARLERWAMHLPPPPPVDPTVRPDRTSRAELAHQADLGRAMFTPQTRCGVCAACQYGGPCERYR